jgi:hypothetical protein
MGKVKQTGGEAPRQPIVEQDSAWKDLLRDHFPDFLRFFFPAVAAEVDLEVVPEFLDAELKRFLRGNSAPHRLADLLVKVHRKTGEEELLYCHVEVQSRNDKTFEQRLLQYAYRILDRLGQLPVTLVVLTDARSSSQLTGRYRLEPIPGNSLTLEYRVVKLLDLQEGVETVLREYEAGRLGQVNIFVAVVEVHLRMQRERTHGNWREAGYRYRFKGGLMRDVVQRYGRDAQLVREVLRFLDWLIMLPQRLDTLYLEDVQTMQEDKTVAYVTSWERIGEARGILKEKRQILQLQVSKKFGLAAEDQSLIETCDDPECFDSALSAILDATTKDEVLQHIR